MRSHDRKGRTKESTASPAQKIDQGGMKGVVVLPKAVLRSPAFRSLSGTAVKVLIVIQARWNGYNNGEIPFSTRELHVACGTRDNTSQANAVHQLVECGLLRITKDANFATKGQAREFALTYIATGDAQQPVPASREYLEWLPTPRERTESIARKTSAKSKQLVRKTNARSETSALETSSVAQTAAAGPSKGTARETNALLYNHHSPPSTSSGHDPEWLQSAAKHMLRDARRGAKTKLADAIGASQVQLSRMLNQGTPLPVDAANKLGTILNSGTRRREFR